MKIIQEFKDFAVKGNMLDMAVGVIIGAAFGKIVSSLVADILMPPLGFLIGGIHLAGLHVNLIDGDSPVVLNYGNFLQQCVDFLIIAFAIFFLIRLVNRMRKPVAAPPAGPTRDQELLTEIRDLLKKS